MEKICYCGKTFIKKNQSNSRWNQRIYCSRACSYKAKDIDCESHTSRWICDCPEMWVMEFTDTQCPDCGVRKSDNVKLWYKAKMGRGAY